MNLNDMLGKVFACEALHLLQALPTASIDAVITDPMYMVAANKENHCTYDWGVEPGDGHAEVSWFSVIWRIAPFELVGKG